MIPSQFKLRTQPIADPKAIVDVGNARFTMLTSRLIRMEYDPESTFEDRPSQVFWYRQQPVPDYEVNRSARQLEVSTQHLVLNYALGKPFQPDTLTVMVKETQKTWRYGDIDTRNLGGTARTLDNIDGQIPLEPGLMSQAGWTVVDDSLSLVFDEDGWLVPRRGTAGISDLYLFAYGHAYQDCLTDYCIVSGPVPMLPRWALGNWWSRYWAYNQGELSQLMLDFKSNRIPLSVCIIDMDWHLTQTGNQCSGWTGYTWNRDLFPEPEKFLGFLDGLGLKKALNLHPAEGIHPHESKYPQIAQAMGIDPESDEPVKFDPEDPGFVQAYFEILHHPQEAIGVDFWWIDWQQGNPARLPGMNLLWWINHLHFQDSARGNDRPFIFSRWGGLGNHRYPIGFSGDTYVTWDSLAFQPYFTATAANVGYGWWSHDIGGHMGGVEGPELYTRWVQFGVFSPIMRLHSTNNRFHERRPWGYDAETLSITRRAMQLRHALIPYLYSMAWRNHRLGIPLIRPMYYFHPEAEQAYVCPNQYYFGSELIAAPFIKPRDTATRLSRAVIWLPKGDWFDFFNGDHVQGDSWQSVYGGLEDIPVFARSGAIVPMADQPSWGGIHNPDTLNIHIFPGADNQFELYEDDANTNAYLKNKYAITEMSQSWSPDQQVFEIHPAQGQVDFLPGQRTYTLIFHAIHQPDQVSASCNGVSRTVDALYDPEHNRLTISRISLTPKDALVVNILSENGAGMYAGENQHKKFRSLLHSFRLDSYTKQALDANKDEIIADPLQLSAYQPFLTQSQMRALLEILTEAGVEHITNAGPEQIVLWNNYQDPIASYRISLEQLIVHNPRFRFQTESGTLPRFKSYRPHRDFQKGNTELTVSYGDLLTIKFTRRPIK